MTRFPFINWWISHDFTNLHIFLAVCGILACLIGTFSGFLFLSQWGIAGLFGVAVIHLFHYQLYRFSHYLKDYENQDRLPVRQIKQVNGLLLAVFLLSYGAAVFIGLLLPWKQAGDFLGKALRLFLAWLLSLLFRPGEPTVKYGMTEEAAFQPENLPLFETSPFFKFLDQIMQVLAGFLLLYLFFRFLKRELEKLIQYLGSLHFDEDERVFLEPEETEEKFKRKKKGWFRKKRPPAFDRTASGRIRKQYWNRVQEKVKQAGDSSLAARLSSMTPAQIGTVLHAGEEKEEKLRRIYEKARYSRDGAGKKEEEEFIDLLR